MATIRTQHAPIPANADDADAVQTRPDTMVHDSGLITAFGHRQLAWWIKRDTYRRSPEWFDHGVCT